MLKPPYRAKRLQHGEVEKHGVGERAESYSPDCVSAASLNLSGLADTTIETDVDDKQTNETFLPILNR